MRTKEFDVNLNGRCLSIVRLKDGAIVADAEIPVEATNAVVDVLTAAKTSGDVQRRAAATASDPTESGNTNASGSSQSATGRSRSTTKKTATSKTTKTAETTNDVQPVQTT